MTRKVAEERLQMHTTCQSTPPSRCPELVFRRYWYACIQRSHPSIRLNCIDVIGNASWRKTEETLIARWRRSLSSEEWCWSLPMRKDDDYAGSITTGIYTDEKTPSSRLEGSFEFWSLYLNIYYKASLRDYIRQTAAGPHCRPHLHFATSLVASMSSAADLEFVQEFVESKILANYETYPILTVFVYDISKYSTKRSLNKLV